MERPRGDDERRADEEHEHRQRRAESPVVAESIAARSHHQCVVLVADGRVFEVPTGYSERLHERIDQEFKQLDIDS